MSDTTSAPAPITFAEARERVLTVLDADPNMRMGGVTFSAVLGTYFIPRSLFDTQPHASMTPNCVLGRAFPDLLAPVAGRRCYSGEYLNAKTIQALLREGDLDPELFTSEARELLVRVQAANDHGYPWCQIALHLRSLYPDAPDPAPLPATPATKELTFA